jgi:hypothetical protein
MSMVGGPEPTRNWLEIANRLPGRSGKQCRDRWCNVLDPTRKRSKWTKEEDVVVLEAYQRLGNSWAAIQQLLPGRTQLQVRDRLRTVAKRSQAASANAGIATAAGSAGGPLRTPAQNTAHANQRSHRLNVQVAMVQQPSGIGSGIGGGLDGGVLAEDLYMADLVTPQEGLQNTRAQTGFSAGSSQRQGGIQGIAGSSMMDQLGMPLDADAAFLAGQWEIPQESPEDEKRIGV